MVPSATFSSRAIALLPRPSAIRANCVFRIENKVFHLNNIQVDRLVIRKSGPPPPLPLTADDPTARTLREATSGRHVDPKVDPTLVVELHGSAPVYESTDIFRDAGFDVPGPPLRLQ